MVLSGTRSPEPGGKAIGQRMCGKRLEVITIDVFASQVFVSPGLAVLLLAAPYALHTIELPIW